MQLRDLETLVHQFQYPGMPALESSIARAWIRQYAAKYDRLDFNVRLGKGRAPIDGLMPEIAAQNTLVSQLRADIIAWYAGSVDIIEVKDRARFNAMGQLKGYRALWVADFPSTPVANLIVVGQSIDPDAETAFKAENINYVIVQPETYP
jgi:hypothetical protein